MAPLGKLSLLALTLLGFTNCVYVPADLYYEDPPAPRYGHDPAYQHQYQHERARQRERERQRRRMDRLEREQREAEAYEDGTRYYEEEEPRSRREPDELANAPEDKGPPPKKELAPLKKPDTGEILTGTTTKAGRAKSPYPPYSELDVSDMTPGSLARDPTTGKVFRVP